MAFVYRTVPSLTSTIKKFGSLSSDQENLEGTLYDLGYISFENVYPFFRQNEGNVNTFRFLDEDYKFFFLFSYDALMCTFSSIEGLCYDKYNFELLEYDIPSEILLKYCGYGFYNGSAHIEFCIPESEFKRNSLGAINTGILSSELSIYNVSHFENKRAYITKFITDKRILYDTSELYDENDFLTFPKIVEQLNQKGIISSNNIFEMYEMFQRSSDDVYNDCEYEVKKLQKNLEKILEK